MNPKNLKLKTKQAIGFGFIVVILGGLNVFTVLRMNALKEEINEIATQRLASAISIADVNQGISVLRSKQFQYALDTSESSKRERGADMAALIDEIQGNQDVYETLITYPRERELYSQFDAKWERYQDLSYQFFELSLTQPEQALDLLSNDAQPAFEDVGTTLQQLITVNQTASLEAAVRSENTFRTTRRLLRVLIVLTVILSAIIARQLVLLVTVPVKKLAAAAAAVASGDVDVSLDVASTDEIGNLSASFNEMTASLRSARDQIQKQQSDLRHTNDELVQKTDNLESALKQLREAQQQLVMKEKMASLGDLVAGVAHEINNPVGAIHSAADTTSRSLDKVAQALEGCTDIDVLRSDRRFAKALEIMKNNSSITVTASERIATLVKSLKNFARLDEAEFQDADIREGIDSTLTLLDHRLKNRIEVIKEYGDVPIIACYPNQLNQVFMNVLSNAEQSIDGQGTVIVRTFTEPGKVVVQFADDGRGIEPEYLSRIFDPGFTTKGVGVGTGLGLSISYNIVKKHNGDCTVESELTKGTTFTIKLPVAQKGDG